jgi:hypothetical protein
VAPSIHKKLAITSPTSGGLSVGIVRSRTRTTEFFFFNFWSFGKGIPVEFPGKSDLHYVSVYEVSQEIYSSEKRQLRVPFVSVYDSFMLNGSVFWKWLVLGLQYDSSAWHAMARYGRKAVTAN